MCTAHEGKSVILLQGTHKIQSQLGPITIDDRDHHAQQSSLARNSIANGRDVIQSPSGAADTDITGCDEDKYKAVS